MRTISLTALLCLVCFATTLGAQSTDPTPTMEAFSVLPNRVQQGAKGVSLRFAAGRADGFASNSAKAPTLAFGAGVTLTSGSFQILNSTEAAAQVDVSETALGAVLVRISFYSPDGTTIVRQEQAHIGVVASTPVGTSEISVKAEKVSLLAVNVLEDQKLGAVELVGRVNGVFTFSPPTGMTFESNTMPVVTVNGGASVSNLRVDSGRTSLSFTVVNTSNAEVTVRIDNLSVDTESFGANGGQVGNQASIITGTSLGDAEAIVINGYTGVSTLEGEDVVDDSDPDQPIDGGDDTGTENPDDTTPETTSNTNNNSSSSANRNRTTEANSAARERSDAPRSNLDTNGNSNATANLPNFQPRPTPNQPNFNRPPPIQANGNFSSPPPPGFTARPGSGSNAADSPRVVLSETAPSSGGDGSPTSVTSGSAPSAKLLRASNLYFATKDFKRQDSVLVSGGRGTRVWVVLERGEDISDQVDSVDVEIRYSGEIQKVRLTETGPTTGVFRSDAKGIEVKVVAAD